MPCTRSAAAAVVLLVTGAAAHAQPRSREDCEAAYPASLGRAGKDVPWVVTSDAVARAMLSMAQVGPTDVLLDLGAGDGKIPIAAAKPPFGARAVGIEYDGELAKRAACLVQAEGLTDKVRIVEGDIFKEDFGDATVVTMYLLPHLNLCVRHRILALAPGTRVVSHKYTMADWEPEKSVQLLSRDVHLWTVPARVDGVWDFQHGDGAQFTIGLRQTFEKLSGDVVREGIRRPLLGATLHGRELRIKFDTGGATAQFSGTVKGGEITGTLLTGNAARTVVGRLRGSLRPASWAMMQPGCNRYYDR